MNFSKTFKIMLVLITMGTSVSLFAQAVKVKDLVNVRGYRTNQLIGFGLVIGLSGTGDSAKSLTTNTAVTTMLQKLGVEVDANGQSAQSIASVIVTADLPAFKRIGDRLDVKVSTIGDAKSLAGGTLILTPLKAGDGNTYVMAQGTVVVGQASGSRAQVLTTALIPNGGSVEKEFMPNITANDKITLSLRSPDFTTSSRIAEEINLSFKGFYAKALDPSSIEVQIPENYLDKTTEFISEIERLLVSVDSKAVVVLNERTGTVVMGANVLIDKIAISHGDLSISIGDNSKESKGTQNVISTGGTSVGDLVETMNTLGVKPADLVGIIQTIHAAGVLRAELKFL